MIGRWVSGLWHKVLVLEDTPERIALGFAVGVFLAFSPLIGLHTLLGLMLAFAFGLNRVALLVGLFVNNPWTFVPIYAAANYIGGLLLGFPKWTALPEFGWSRLWQGSYWVALAKQWRLLLPMVLGSAILSVLFAMLSYTGALYVLKQHKPDPRSQNSTQRADAASA